ncbi:MAG: hypothetical protein WKF75_11155 [Singulisphaera sp.]
MADDLGYGLTPPSRARHPVPERPIMDPALAHHEIRIAAKWWWDSPVRRHDETLPSDARRTSRSKFQALDVQASSRGGPS